MSIRSVTSKRLVSKPSTVTMACHHFFSLRVAEGHPSHRQFACAILNLNPHILKLVLDLVRKKETRFGHLLKCCFMLLHVVYIGFMSCLCHAF